MAITVPNISSEDTVKRGKLISLSLFIALTIFIQTLLQVSEGRTVQVFLIGIGYFVLSFIGLIWAFNFQVKFKSIPFLVFSSLFVLSEYLFVQLFFVQKFSRIYEGLILLVLIGLVFTATYVSFLMVNVFNVNLYKNILLVHVGRTTSYIISTFTMFFMIFALLASELPFFILIPSVILVCSFLTYIHLSNLGFQQALLYRKSLLVSLLVIFLFLGTFISGFVHEVSTITPVVGYFAGVGIANLRNSNSKAWEILLYFGIIIIALLLTFRLSIFS